MRKYEIKQGGMDDLDSIKPLWEKLNQIHHAISPFFKERFHNMDWDKRKSKLLNKASEILFEYAIDKEEKKIIGYCISTIHKDDTKIGEIDSIYIDDAYRKSGIGKKFIENALQWLKSKNTETQILYVSVGNEKVLDFYKQFNFYPLHIELQRIDK